MLLPDEEEDSTDATDIRELILLLLVLLVNLAVSISLSLLVSDICGATGAIGFVMEPGTGWVKRTGVGGGILFCTDIGGLQIFVGLKDWWRVPCCGWGATGAVGFLVDSDRISRGCGKFSFCLASSVWISTTTMLCDLECTIDDYFSFGSTSASRI